MASSLVYEPLPDIECTRVLKLHPGHHNDKIKCALEIVSLKRSKDKYEAISYVWGDPSITDDIICNETVVPVTVNLADALRRFRHLKEIRTLWADALCINQKDIQEKSHQVKRMDLVYEHAKRVLVWLGGDPNGLAEDCFELIQDTNGYFDKQFLNNDQDYALMPMLPKPYPICVDETRWTSVKTLLDLPWFERVWIMQEAALAKECIMFWGAADIDIADIFEFSLWYVKKVDFGAIVNSFSFPLRIGEPTSAFITVHSKYKNRQSWRYSRPALKHEWLDRQGGSFADVLGVGSDWKATDPRDYVYAFLGCPYAKQKDGRPIVKADYTMSVEEVYFQTACSLLQHPREGPWLLSAIEHRTLDDLKQSERPSWVPYWYDRENLLLNIANQNFWYRAGGPSKLFSAKPQQNNVLEVAGFVFDTVVWKSTMIHMNNVSLKPEHWDEDIRATGEPLLDSLWKATSSAAERFRFSLEDDDFTLTLVMGYNANRPKKPNMTRHHADFGEYRRLIRSAISKLPEDAPPPDSGTGDPYFVQDQLEYCRYLSLILTENGRLGLAPGVATEIGDVCCIFLGATVPFILKPSQDSRYKLVGESYIHGVMDGELKKQFDIGEFNLESIFLE